MAVIHILALDLFLYWRYLWLDMPMHVLGGIVAALGIFVLHDLRVPLPKNWDKFLSILTTVLIVALLWEIYEIQLGLLVFGDYRLDTLSDLFFGLLGGAFGYLIGTRLKSFEASLV